MPLSTTQKDYFLAICSGFFLFILPFTHTIAIRLSLFLIVFIAVIFIYRLNAIRNIPTQKVLLLWLVFPVLILPFAWNIAYSLNEIKVEIVYSVMAFSIFFTLAYQKIFFIKSALIAMSLSLLLVSLWGLWNSYENQGLWLETARHNGSASYISYTLVLIPLLLFAQCVFVRQRLWIISLLVLLILTSFLSGQRIFIVALLAQLVIFGLWAKQYLTISTQKLMIISTVFILLSTLLAFASLLNRFDGSIEAAIHYQQNDPRFELISIPLELIKNSPFIGYGFGRETMLHVIGGETALDKILQSYPEGYQYSHAHNVLLNIAIEVGLLGLVIFASVFVSLFRHYYCCAKDEQPIVAAAGMAGMAILVGFLVRNQTNDMFYRDMSLFFWSTQGLLLGFIVKIQSKKDVYKAMNISI